MITFINKNFIKIVSIIKVKFRNNIKSNFLLRKTMTSSLKRKVTSDQINPDSSDHCIQTNQQIQATKRIKVLKPVYRLDDSDYYIENGLRKVYPYYFTYFAHCKGRWVGRKLAQFYCQEFRAMPINKIEKRIKEGLLLVNNEKVDVNHELKGHDLLTHKVHRHELPVLATPIPIIHLSDEMLVIDKPPSLPIHPCGRYRHNCVLSILEREHQLKDLHTIHRLDRLTSGVLLIARSTQMAQKLHEQIRNRTVVKEYVCRVEGLFPDGIVSCDQPIEVLAHKIGICVVSPNGKPSTTIFERLNYNGKSSTVLCKPITGRMHQIRVHLQYLGFPIVNDSFYNNFVFGPQKGKLGQFGKTREQLIKDLNEEHSKSKWIVNGDQCLDNESEHESNPEENDIAFKALSHYTNQESWITSQSKYRFDDKKQVLDEDCEECQITTHDPKLKNLFICLHALRYKGNDWEYESSMPVWAKDDWNYDLNV